MKTRTKSTAKFTLNSLIIISMAFFIISCKGCKPKPPVNIDDDKEEVVKVDTKLIQAKATVKELLSDECTKSIEEKEKIIADIKAMGYDDEELNSLIKQVEDDIAKEKERIRIEEEKRKEAAKPENRLRRYFANIVTAGDESVANSNIEEAIGLFVSDQANVLIIISQDEHYTDYDEPTKIRKYLNYLKDTKTNINDVHEIKWEGEKIKTLILKKKK